VPSVGSIGDSYDNALAETINGLYKAEVGPIGHIPPAEAEANYYAATGNLDRVA
jgi:putative transposase